MPDPEIELKFLTSAQFSFLANIERPKAFLRLFDRPGGAKRGRGRPSDDEKELLRAVVVFSVAALDAYLHDLVIEEVPKRGVHSEALAEAMRSIAKEDPALALRVALAEGLNARQDEFRKALEDWLSAKSFQGPEAVVRTLSLVGQPTKASSLNKRIGENWTEQLVAWTTMRHGMVHRAEKPYVPRSHAASCLSLISRIVAAVDDIVIGTK
jgi:hypothetical protein